MVPPFRDLIVASKSLNYLHLQCWVLLWFRLIASSKHSCTPLVHTCPNLFFPAPLLVVPLVVPEHIFVQFSTCSLETSTQCSNSSKYVQQLQTHFNKCMCFFVFNQSCAWQAASLGCRRPFLGFQTAQADFGQVLRQAGAKVFRSRMIGATKWVEWNCEFYWSSCYCKVEPPRTQFPRHRMLQKVTHHMFWTFTPGISCLRWGMNRGGEAGPNVDTRAGPNKLKTTQERRIHWLDIWTSHESWQ